jgi:FAD/FMN-containing dehydrogenase
MTEQATIEAVPQLGEGFKGEVIAPGDPGYDNARAVWNGSIDKRPALIVRPTGAADVIDAVNYARAEGVPLAVRCGGHSVAGNGTVDGGVLVDLSSLKGVHVDPQARTARVNGGVLVGELDRETQLFGLATPAAGSRRPVWAGSPLVAATDGSRPSSGWPATTYSRRRS